MYNLTSHKGIKYFRLSFLFFAIAFFFRSFIRFLLTFLNIPRVFDLSIQGFGILSLFIFMYASSMAIFYLLFSVIWKRWESSKILFFHILAVIIAIITLLVRNAGIILLIHTLLFLFLIVVIWISYKESREKRKGQHLHGIYILLFAFWILHIIDLIIPSALQFFQLLIYLSSLAIFLSILYKVLKKVG